MTSYEDRYLDLDGLRTRYRCTGEPGEPVVLLHGLASSLDIWEAAMPRLARSRRVYAFDLPGHGHSAPPSEPRYDTDFLVDHLDAFLDAVGLRPTAVVGLSLGGAVALRYLLRFGTGRVTKLVLVGSAGLGRGLHAGFRAATVPGLGEELTRPSREGMARQLRHMVYDKATIDDRMVDGAFRNARRPGVQQTLLGALRANVDIEGQRPWLYEPIVAMLPAIDIPTLIVWGENDEMIPVEHGRRAAERMPGARLHVVPRCGHLPPVEHPGEFGRVVGEFLGEDFRRDDARTGRL